MKKQSFHLLSRQSNNHSQRTLKKKKNVMSVVIFLSQLVISLVKSCWSSPWVSLRLQYNIPVFHSTSLFCLLFLSLLTKSFFLAVFFFFFGPFFIPPPFFLCFQGSHSFSCFHYFNSKSGQIYVSLVSSFPMSPVTWWIFPQKCPALSLNPRCIKPHLPSPSIFD